MFSVAENRDLKTLEKENVGKFFRKERKIKRLGKIRMDRRFKGREKNKFKL